MLNSYWVSSDQRKEKKMFFNFNLKELERNIEVIKKPGKSKWKNLKYKYRVCKMRNVNVGLKGH